MKKNPTSSPKTTLTFFAMASIMFCLVSANVSADEKNSTPETINLNIQVNHADIKGLPKDKKSVNNFTHSKHAGEYLKGNSKHAAKPFADDFTCAACHINAKSPTDITDSVPQERLLATLNAKGGPKKIKNYFHEICLSCHKSMKKAQMTTGPTKCNGCHKRK